jgi:hypothetical protein
MMWDNGVGSSAKSARWHTHRTPVVFMQCEFKVLVTHRDPTPYGLQYHSYYADMGIST